MAYRSWTSSIRQGLLLPLGLPGPGHPDTTRPICLAQPHLLPPRPGSDIQDPLSAGEHLLPADDEALGLHAVVELILIGVGGGKGS
mgnify:CR=1 FL=1